MMAESGLKSLLVSCPSYDEETFTKITRNKIGYNRFLENLGLVRDADMNCTVNMVVTQANKHQVYETGKLLHESYGVANFGATPISPSTPQHIDKVLTREESIKVFDDLKQLHHDYGLQVTTLRPIPLCLFPDSKDYSEFMRCCSLMKNEIYITIEGDVSGCGSVPLVYGNLFDEGLRTCIEKGAEQHSSEKIIPSECTPCAEANICRGGCRAEAMTTFGEISSVNPYFVEILNEKKLPDIQPSINMYEATIIIDPEANLRQGDTKDVFVYSAFGNEVALNKYESNLMALFEKEGLSLSDLTQRHTLNSRAVNQFFNNMANKGGISLGGN